MSEKQFIDFNQLVSGIAELAEKIVNGPVKYDVMIAIAGGGLVPARLLRNYLKLPIYSVNIKTYGEESKEKSGEVEVVQWLGKAECCSLGGKNILFVDDLDDTRGTLKHVIELLNSQDEGISTGEVGFAVLYNKIKEKAYKLPEEYHYYSARDAKDKWIVFPWERE